MPVIFCRKHDVLLHLILLEGRSDHLGTESESAVVIGNLDGSKLDEIGHVSLRPALHLIRIMKCDITDDGIMLSGDDYSAFRESCNFDQCFMLILRFAESVEIRMHLKAL
ncbi:hypothetical protein D3C77_404110 [compost metagenome]